MEDLMTEQNRNAKERIGNSTFVTQSATVTTQVGVKRGGVGTNKARPSLPGGSSISNKH